MQWKGRVRERWGKLTDDQLDVVGGRRDQLSGRIQEAYGLDKDEAERQLRQAKELIRRAFKARSYDEALAI